MTNYADALKTAAKEKKAVLMDFTGSDWCGWCIKLKKEVFDKPDFADWAKKNVVLVEVDFPHNKKLPDDVAKQNAELQAKFKIEGYPTIVFVDATGKELGRSGYLEGGPSAWTKEADGILSSKPGDAKPGDAKQGDGAAAGEGGWMTNYEEALKLAKKEKKIVVANFTGSDWCPWCIKLHDEVFDKPEFKEWAKKNAVLLIVDFPHKALPADVKTQNDELMKKYKSEVPGYPTVLFLDSKGKSVGKMGYEAGGPANWIKKAQKLADKK